MAVYIIEALESKKIKIGFTKDTPDERLSSLQTACPESLRLLYFVPQATMGCEKLLHKINEEQRIRGEWFKPEGLVLEMLDAVSKGGSVGLADFIEKHRHRANIFEIIAAKKGREDMRSLKETCAPPKTKENERPKASLLKMPSKRKVTLTRICKTEVGRRRYPAAWDENGNVIPGVVFCQGRNVFFEIGWYTIRYYVDGKVKLRHIGKDSVEAQKVFEDFKWMAKTVDLRTIKPVIKPEYAHLYALFAAA